jgi:hypothetical protein
MARQIDAAQGLPFFGFRNLVYRRLVEPLSRGIDPSEDLCLHRTTETQKKNVYIHASSEIRTHDPNFVMVNKIHALHRAATVTGLLKR